MNPLVFFLSMLLASVDCTCPLRDCKESPIELGIVLDSSVSIRPDHYTEGIEFLQNFLGEFDIGREENQVRVSLIKYGRGIYTQESFNLTTFQTKQEVIDAVGNLTHRRGSYTNTEKGIRYMATHQLDEAHTREGVPRVGVVITDGNSQNMDLTKSEAVAARNDGIIMIAIGVGHEIKDEELINIAGYWKQVIQVNNYEQLENITAQLINTTCRKVLPPPPACEGSSIELGIALDSSQSIWPNPYRKGIEFLQHFLGEFDIGMEENQVRVSIIPFGNDIYEQDAFNLTTYQTKQEVIDAVGNLTYRQGGYTNTEKAIKYMATHQLDKAQSREGVPRVGVVLTDGNSQKTNLTKSEALAARLDGIIMIAIGVGREEKITEKELMNIAGDKKLVIRVNSYDELENIKSQLINTTCTEIC